MYTKPETMQSDIFAVQKLGEEIGYGHMMAIVSALWRKSLKEKNYPIGGAFVPTIMELITEEGQKLTNEVSYMYDKLVIGSLYDLKSV